MFLEATQKYNQDLIEAAIDLHRARRIPPNTYVIDLDSVNGTYLNYSPDPIEPHTPVPVGNGDRIHVGGWTTLTLSAAA